MLALPDKNTLPTLLNGLDHLSDKEVAKRCRQSFFFFLKEFWSTIIEQEPVWNWHIPYLCRQLELIAWRVIARQEKRYDLIINIPPGTTKTTVCSIAFPVWGWIAELPRNLFPTTYKKRKIGKDDTITGKDLRFITGSYAQDITLKNSLASRDLIRSDKFKSYFPEIEIRRDQDVKSDYSNTAKGSRFSTSVGSRVMGTHAHIIIIDDPIDPEQALSDADRNKANNFIDNVQTRKVNKLVTPLILIMQRLHQMDPTGHLLSQQRDKKTIRHLRLPGTSEYEIKPTSLKERYADGYLDPIRLNRRACEDLRTRLGSYGYSGQVGQDPRPREGGMFRREDFEIVKAAPASSLPIVRGWDLAATTEKENKQSKHGPAYSAGVKMSYSGGVFYIHHISRFRKNPLGVRVKMKNLATQDGADNMIIDIPQDPGQAGKDQAQSIVRYLVGYNVRYSVESGDKVLRANPFSAQAEAGNVKLVEGDWNEDFLSEVEYFPNGFKDQVDAAVRAFNRLLKLSRTHQGEVGGPVGVDNARNFNPEQGE